MFESKVIFDGQVWVRRMSSEELEGCLAFARAAARLPPPPDAAVGVSKYSANLSRVVAVIFG